MKTNIFVLPNHVQPPLIKHGVLNLHTLICHLGGCQVANVWMMLLWLPEV